MPKSITLIWGLILCFFPYDSLAQNASDLFHAEIMKLYNFQSRTFSKEELNKKSAELDHLWKKVKIDQNLYLPLLRKELLNVDNPPFFFYDGSKLLVSLSKTIDDKKIVLQAIPQSDLTDIDPTDYLRTIHRLALDQLDTSAAALRILDFPWYRAIIAQHALILGMDYSLIYMLIPTEESYYLNKAIDRFKIEKNDESKKALIRFLWYTVTKEGDRVIEGFIADSQQPADLREFAEKFVQDKKDQVSSASLVGFSLSSFNSLRMERQEGLKSISDEALYPFERNTIKMRRKMK